MQSAGEAIAPAAWSLRTRVPSFELQTRSDRAQTYYLRFENNRALTGRPMLLSPVEYVNGASRVGVVIGLMWGMFSVLAALSIAAFAMARNRVFLWFGAVVVTLMFTQLVLIGYGSWRMWPGSAHLNQVMGWVSATLSLAAGAWFCAQAGYARSGHPHIYRLLVDRHRGQPADGRHDGDPAGLHPARPAQSVAGDGHGGDSRQPGLDVAARAGLEPAAAAGHSAHRPGSTGTAFPTTRAGS